MGIHTLSSITSVVSSELQVSNMLDRLYTKFDELAAEHGVTNVDTIGDACVPPFTPLLNLKKCKYFILDPHHTRSPARPSAINPPLPRLVCFKQEMQTHSRDGARWTITDGSSVVDLSIMNSVHILSMCILRFATCTEL